jgi:hypothetical protein
MARKRGGLAGFYDRNKGILQKLAPIAAGAIGGPMAGAAVGAAMRGLDRPGKSGIGFDIGEGLQGGVSGYMAGQTGAALKGGIKNLLAPRMAERAGAKGLAAGTKALEGFQVPDLTDYNALSDIGVRQRGIFEGLTGEGGAPLTSRLTTAAAPNIAAAAPRVVAPTARAAAGSVGPMASSPVTAPQGMLNRTPSLETINRSMGATPTPNPADVLENKPGRFGRFADQFRKNKDIIEMVGKYAMPPRESQADLMRAETDRRQQEAQQRFYEFQMQQTRDAEARDLERRRAVLQFLSPYIRQNAPLLNPSAFGMEG